MIWLWVAFGYSLTFSPGTFYGLVGNTDRFWLGGMTFNAPHTMAPMVPEAIFCAYQLCFAIVTAGLAFGSLTRRYGHYSDLN
jgi:Amt family ammonium transporter